MKNTTDKEYADLVNEVCGLIVKVANKIESMTQEPPKKEYTVDIHWDYAQSQKVIATSEEEAKQLVELMIQHGELLPIEAEPTGDYELSVF